jgi:hypothetical protein
MSAEGFNFVIIFLLERQHLNEIHSQAFVMSIGRFPSELRSGFEGQTGTGKLSLCGGRNG